MSAEGAVPKRMIFHWGNMKNLIHCPSILLRLAIVGISFYTAFYGYYETSLSEDGRVGMISMGFVGVAIIFFTVLTRKVPNDLKKKF